MSKQEQQELEEFKALSEVGNASGFTDLDKEKSNFPFHGEERKVDAIAQALPVLHLVQNILSFILF